MRNKKLDAMLGEKMAKAEQNQHWTFDFSQGDSSQTMDPETQQQLQSHGFDFSQPLPTSASPHSESVTSDVSYHSPAPAQNPSTLVASQSPFRHQSENWAQQQLLTRQAQGQTAIWDSALQQSPGPGFNMSQDLFNQLQGFHEGLEGFGMDVSMDSSSGWPDDSSGTNQLVNMSPVTSWPHAQDSPFDR